MSNKVSQTEWKYFFKSDMDRNYFIASSSDCFKAYIFGIPLKGLKYIY